MLHCSSFVRQCIANGVNSLIPVANTTPLTHVLSHQPDDAAVEMLLQAGADPNKRDLNGWTPLAALLCNYSRFHVRMLWLLLVYGADPTRRGRFHETPMEIILNRGNIFDNSTLKLLNAAVQKKWQRNVVQAYQKLLVMCRSNQSTAFKALDAHGALFEITKRVC